jgi:hypothetical protein
MSKATSTKSVSTTTAKPAQPAQPAKGSTLATLQAATAPVSAAPAAPVKPAAVAVVAGLVNGAPANAQPFVVGGTAYTGNLRPHHARQQTTGNTNRLPAGTVTITAKGALLKPGGVAYNAMAWQAITLAIGKGACTAAELAAAVGNGGAAHVAYRIKGGWLAVAK